MCQNQGLVLRLAQEVGQRASGLRLSMVSMSFLARRSLKFLGNSTLPWMMLSQISQGFSVFPPKGSSPTMNSNSITPTDQRSTSSLYSLPKMISGAMQCGVPMTVLVLCSWLMILAEPKEISRRQPRQSTMKLSGFRSRITISWLMKYSRRRINEAAQNWVSAVLRRPIYRMESYRHSPCTYSVILRMVEESSQMEQKAGMKGWAATSVTPISCLATSMSPAFSRSTLRYNLPIRYFFACFISNIVFSAEPRSSPTTTTSLKSNSELWIRLSSDRSRTDLWFAWIVIKFLRLSQISTLSVSTMMSSSNILLSESLRKASPQVCPVSARQLALLNFFNFPSMTTISFSTAFPLLKMYLPALLYSTLNPSKNSSSSFFIKLSSSLFFCTTCLTQFLNIISLKSGPMIFAKVSLPSTWQTTSSSALTVILRMVLQQSELWPKLSPLQILRSSKFPCRREAVPSFMMQKEDPGSPSSTMFCPLQYFKVTKEDATFSFCWGRRNWQKAIPSRNFWLDQNSLMTISSTASLKLTLSITQKDVGSLVIAVDGRQISYSRASSPNPSPTFSSLVSSSSTLICTEPFWMMQKQEPTVPCLKTSAPGGISQRYMLSLTLSSSFSERLQKMKWLRRQLRMNILSVSERGNSRGSRPSSLTLTRTSLSRRSYSCRQFLMDYSIMIINAEPNSITIFSNCMLDWCRNQQPANDHAHQLTFPAGLAVSNGQRCRTLAPPKFSSNANPQSTKRGIKIHVTKAFKVDQHVQTVHHAWEKIGIDFGTQTESLSIHPLNSRKNSRVSSRQPSPTHKHTPNIVIRPQPCRSEQGWALEGSKTIDCRNQINRQTKASYNLLESQGMPTLRYEDHFARNFKGVESYHIPEEKTASREEDNPSPTFEARFTEKIIRPVPEELNYNQRMMQSMAGHGQEDHQYCGYRNMLRNVESEFKFAGQKMSDKKLKYTPDKRILFHDRETIVSKYGESHKDEDRSLRVEESLVYDRDVRSAFTPLGKLSSHQSFLIFLALEKTTGQAVSIKQVQVRFIDCISEEMMTYRQLDAKHACIEGILELYQTQIDRDSYLFIKEPFTASLMEYLSKGNRQLVEEVCTSVAKILAQMQSAGFALKSHPKMEDFVVCLSTVKLHNAGIFKYQGIQKIPIAQAMKYLREEILQYLQ